MAMDKYGIKVESKGNAMRGGDPFGYKHMFDGNTVGVKKNDIQKNGCICDSGASIETPKFEAKKDNEITL
ncbi:MAG: hypothetical protein N4A47_06045 [Clostridia bacterium]|jgi:hypothetical protein|nr:hypothetical protein [Clostridia bacterium]